MPARAQGCLVSLEPATKSCPSWGCSTFCGSLLTPGCSGAGQALMLFSFPMWCGMWVWFWGRVTALGKGVTRLPTPQESVWVSWGQLCPWAAPATPVFTGGCAGWDGRQGPVRLALGEIRAWFVQEVHPPSSVRFGHRSEAADGGSSEHLPAPNNNQLQAPVQPWAGTGGQLLGAAHLPAGQAARGWG